MPVSSSSSLPPPAMLFSFALSLLSPAPPPQALAGLNRDTQNPVNKLAEIFDKNDVKEKQEFIGLAQELGHKMRGD